MYLQYVMFFNGHPCVSGCCGRLVWLAGLPPPAKAAENRKSTLNIKQEQQTQNNLTRTETERDVSSLIFSLRILLTMSGEYVEDESAILAEEDPAVAPAQGGAEEGDGANMDANGDPVRDWRVQ